MINNKINRYFKKTFLIIFSLLMMVILITPSVVCAQNTESENSVLHLTDIAPLGLIYQSYDVSIFEFTSQPFATSDNNRLTVAASATVKSGNPTTVTFKLQKKILLFYYTEKTVTIPITGTAQTVLDAYPVDINGNYRFAMICNGNDAINVAAVGIAINTWKYSE